MDIQARTKRWLELDPQLKARVNSLKKRFSVLFSDTSEPFFVSLAPGRAEILGNHTDYNEGFTLSANITKNLLIVGKPRKDTTVEIVSTDRGGEIIRFDCSSIEQIIDAKTDMNEPESWANFVKGVIVSFKKRGYSISGFSAVIQSTIPIGSGVSSSAAIELAMAHFLSSFNTITLSDEDLVPVCKEAENEYVGAPCGYLDQGTIALADNGWLTMDYREKDGKPFQWQKISMDLGESGYAMVVGFDLASKRQLVDGKYAVRQKVCKESIPVFNQLLSRTDIKALRDVSSIEFEKVKAELLKKHGQQMTNFAEHIIYDDERVLEAQKALEHKDMKTFGKLMTDSGKSAIYLYDLGEGCEELSFIYETVVAHQSEWGVSGIRNMGGGFNATTLALVKADSIVKYQSYLQKVYQEKYHRQYQFLSFVPSPAAGMIEV